MPSKLFVRIETEPGVGYPSTKDVLADVLAAWVLVGYSWCLRLGMSVGRAGSDLRLSTGLVDPAQYGKSGLSSKGWLLSTVNASRKDSMSSNNCSGQKFLIASRILMCLAKKTPARSEIVGFGCAAAAYSDQYTCVAFMAQTIPCGS